MAEHQQDPGQRPMQKRLAKEVTVMVHSEDDYNAAVEASQILFSNKADEILHNIDEKTLLEVFEGVPTFSLPKADLEQVCRCLIFLPQRQVYSLQKVRQGRWCSRVV